MTVADALAAAANGTPTASPAGTPVAVRKSQAVTIKPPADENAETETEKEDKEAPADVAASSPAATDTTEVSQQEEPDAATEEALPRPVYEEGQWSFENPSGAKTYSKDFMLAFHKACISKPSDFRTDIDDIMAQGNKGGNVKTQGFNPGFNQQGQNFRQNSARGSSVGNRGSNDGRNRTRAPHNSGKPTRQITLPPREQAVLNKAENRYVPSSQSSAEKDEAVERLNSARTILNKMTLEKFDSLSEKLLKLCAADTEQLDEFVQMIFVKAMDESFFSMIYAKLCRRLADAVDGIDGDGKPSLAIPGFRKVLLNRCQLEFERNSKAAEVIDKQEDEKAAKAKAGKDAVEIESETTMTEEEKKTAEAKKREDEREEMYARNKTKRHMLGNIEFIGELFKEQMVSQRIVNHCISHLLKNEVPDDESIESLCKLLETAGGKLEAAIKSAKKTKGQEDPNKTFQRFFDKLSSITKTKELSSRIKFMILDILDMRARNWKARMEKKGPKTLDQIHAEAKYEAMQKEANSGSGGRGSGKGSQGGRGSQGARASQGGRAPGSSSQSTDGWNTVPPTKPSHKVDLAAFNKGAKTQLGGNGKMTLGGGANQMGMAGGAKAWGSGRGSNEEAGSVDASGVYKKKGATRGNTFSALLNAGSGSGGNGGGSPLLARAKAAKAGRDSSTPPPSESPSTPPVGVPCKFTRDQLANKVNGTLDEWMSIKSFDEVKESLKEWGPHDDAAQQLVEAAFSKAEDISAPNRAVLQDLFVKLVGAKDGAADLCSAHVFSAAVNAHLLLLGDLMMDVPQAHKYLAGFIGAAAAADNSVIKVLAQLEQSAMSEDLKLGLYGTLPLKVVLETFAAVKARSGDSAMFEAHSKLGIDLIKFGPADRFSREDLVELCDRAGVAVLLNATSSSAKGSIAELFEARSSGDDVCEWIESNYPAEKRDTPDFVRELAMAITKSTVQQTTFQDGMSPAAPVSNDAIGAEKGLAEERLKVLMKYVDPDNRDDLQLHALCSVQAVASELDFPKDMVTRWFGYLYECDVIYEEVMQTWKTEEKISKSGQYPGKDTALGLVLDFLKQLDEADEEHPDE